MSTCSDEGHWHCRRLLSCRSEVGFIGCQGRALDWEGRWDFNSCFHAVWPWGVWVFLGLHWEVVGLHICISVLPLCASSWRRQTGNYSEPTSSSRQGWALLWSPGFQQSLRGKCLTFLLFIRGGCDESLSCWGGQLLSQWQITFGKGQPACGALWQQDHYCDGSLFWQGSWEAVGKSPSSKGSAVCHLPESVQSFPRLSRGYVGMCQTHPSLVFKDQESSCFLRHQIHPAYSQCLLVPHAPT